MDVKPASGGALLSSIVIGNVPRVETIFVAFEDGKRHQTALSQGSRSQMQKVDNAIARFNSMVDIVDQEAQKTQAAQASRDALARVRESKVRQQRNSE
jgi:hypothetical protein